MRLPSISFVIATFNSEKTIERCLQSIRTQDYPQKKIEIILADGGSEDSTSIIAKTYAAQIVDVDKTKQGPEYNRAIGAHHAKNEILAFLDHDNELPYNNWFSDMVRPLVEDRDIVGVETLRYHYDKRERLLGRYFSLFGVNDVLPFYLGKADRLSYLYDEPQQYGAFKEAEVVDKGSYFVVNFQKETIPTLGSNGFLIRKELLLSHAQSDPDMFFHIDVNVDLIRKGFTKYAFVKNTIIHKPNERGLFDYFRRRRLFVVRYHMKDLAKRRYSVFEKKDFWRLLIFIVISATFIKPFLDALRGFIKIRDSAWFIHPILCFGTLIVYGATVMEFSFQRLTEYANFDL